MLQSSSIVRRKEPRAAPARDTLVYIVDDDVSVRESLEALVVSAGWWAQGFASAQAFLEDACVAKVGCLILDVGLPDMSGLDLQRCVKDVHGCLPIIFITGDADVPTAVDAMKGGATEFLTKPIDAEKLVAAIERATTLSRARSGMEVEVAELRGRYESLTPREAQVMSLVVRGRLNKQTAAYLEISEITVKAHRGRVMRKMKVRSVPDLVRIAAKLGVDR